jgi:hypothetical protein
MNTFLDFYLEMSPLRSIYSKWQIAVSRDVAPN